MFQTLKSLAAPAKPKKKQQNVENVSEVVREFSNDFVHTAQQEGKNLITDAFKQLVTLEQAVKSLSGELKAGQSVDIAQMEHTQGAQQHQAAEYPEAMARSLPGIDYHREFARINEVRVVKEDSRHIQVRIDQIMMELKRLTASSQELTVQFSEVTMEEAPVDAGTYHLNFFEWVSSVIRKARERIDESQTWLSMFQSKKGQKTYWNMFKKHGTTFGLSGERVVATQTG